MTTAEFQQVVTLAKKLSDAEKKQLIEAMTAELKEESPEQSAPRRSLYGILAHLGNVPSEESIDKRAVRCGATSHERISNCQDNIRQQDDLVVIRALPNQLRQSGKSLERGFHARNSPSFNNSKLITGTGM